MSTATLYRPGTSVVVTDQPAPVSAPTDTDAWFIVGQTTYGVTGDYRLVRSLSDFTSFYGPRLATSVMYDCVETFFREGGARCYVSRQAPAGGTAASVNLKDSLAASCLHVVAGGTGLYGNALTVAVVAVAGGGYQFVVAYQGATIETSPPLVTNADAVAWQSYTLDITSTGANAPAPAAAAPLVGGVDGTYSDAGITTALACFPASLGPGQVSAPGRTTATAQQPVLAHALAANRTALCDLADTSDVPTLQAAATALRTGGDQDHCGGLFAPWAVIAGIAAGTTRQVPWSPIQAGIYARNEASGVSVAQPGAGQTYGVSRTALALTQTYPDAARDTLTSSGVNTARGDLGVLESYGSRTLVDATQFPQWRELAQRRLIMAITAEAEAIAEQHLFAVIDGRGHEIATFGGQLTAMLVPYYDQGALYGSTPQEAFSVDVGAAVNTPATIAAGQLRAVIALRCSHMAELVYVEIVKVETTQSL